jgi:hypothetical protein
MSRKTEEAKREQRRIQIAANLLAGLNYRQMADGLGVSLGTISNDVAIIMKRWKREQLQSVDEYVQIDVERLNVLINALWKKAQSGNLGSIDRMLRIIERREKLLAYGSGKRNDQTHLNIDLSTLTLDQLEQIAQGDDPLNVIANASGGTDRNTQEG